MMIAAGSPPARSETMEDPPTGAFHAHADAAVAADYEMRSASAPNLRHLASQGSGPLVMGGGSGMPPVGMGIPGAMHPAMHPGMFPPPWAMMPPFPGMPQPPWAGMMPPYPGMHAMGPPPPLSAYGGATAAPAAAAAAAAAAAPATGGGASMRPAAAAATTSAGASADGDGSGSGGSAKANGRHSPNGHSNGAGGR
jgi:DNA polymerase-3 subunit gamma/tau